MAVRGSEGLNHAEAVIWGGKHREMGDAQTENQWDLLTEQLAAGKREGEEGGESQFSGLTAMPFLETGEKGGTADLGRKMLAFVSRWLWARPMERVHRQLDQWICPRFHSTLFFFFFFFFFLLGCTPGTWRSWARDQIWAAAGNYTTAVAMLDP